MTAKPIWVFPIAVDRRLRQTGLALRRCWFAFEDTGKEASVVAAEGDPELPIHPRPSADPLSHLNGLLSADVRQLGYGVLVVYIAGELDMLTGPPLQDHLDELLATRPDRLIIDLSQVSFMGSTGLSVLICTRQNAIAMGTTLQLSGTSARAISVLLEVTGLNDLFEMLPTPPTTGDAGR